MKNFDLRKKTVNGLVWAFTSQAVRQGSGLIITALFARLLTPKDFGLMGMAGVFTGFAAIFSDLGVSAALIHKQYSDEIYLCSAFWLNIGMGVLLTLISIGCSGLISIFYNQPELKEILIVLSFNYIIASFTIIQRALLTKEMNFKALAGREMASLISGAVIGLWLARNGFGVWSLVYQALISNIVNVISLWVLSRWRPKFIFSRRTVKEIFSFSLKITGFQIINYASRNLDFLLIGKFLGAEPLGFYALAYRLMQAPLKNVSNIVNKIVFPAVSKIQKDLARVKAVYLKIIRGVSLVSFPMMCVLFAVAGEFVIIFYGAKWAPVIVLVKILCFCGIVQSITAFNGTIYMSLGKPGIQLKMSVIHAVLTSIVIMLGLKNGIFAIALYYTIFQLIWFNFSLKILADSINLKISKVYFALSPVLISGLIASILVLFLKPLFIYPAALKLLMSLFLFTSVYFLSLFFTGQIKFIKNEFLLSLDANA